MISVSDSIDYTEKSTTKCTVRLYLKHSSFVQNRNYQINSKGDKWRKVDLPLTLILQWFLDFLSSLPLSYQHQYPAKNENKKEYALETTELKLENKLLKHETGWKASVKNKVGSLCSLIKYFGSNIITNFLKMLKSSVGNWWASTIRNFVHTMVVSKAL